jgi:acyl dehydratase
MYFVAAVLAVLAGLFYAAGNNEIGSLGFQMCQYGSTFCDHPSYVLAGAILAAISDRALKRRSPSTGSSTVNETEKPCGGWK